MIVVAGYLWSLPLIVAVLDFPNLEVALGFAEEHFRAGRYFEAAGIYDRFDVDMTPNGLYRLNQGNVHYLAGELPQAILAYRQAERYLGSDPRLRANLAEARKQVPYPSTGAMPRELTRFIALARPAQARSALIAYALAWLALTVWLVRGRRGLLILSLVLLLASGTLAILVLRAERLDRERPIAVVIDNGTFLRKGNGASYPAVELKGVEIKLARGVEARVRSRRPNGWVQLEFPDGLVGWVHAEQVLIDQPGGGTARATNPSS